MDAFVSRSKGRSSADFNNQATVDLLTHMGNIWRTTADYYNKVRYDEINNYGNPVVKERESLYQFLRNTVASAAMFKPVGIAKLVATSADSSNLTFKPIASYFFGGSGAFPGFDSYIYDTHVAANYYYALEHGVFSQARSFSDDSLEDQRKIPLLCHSNSP